MRTDISQAELIEQLDYNPLTGAFAWKRHYLKSYIGKYTHETTIYGYHQIRFNGKRYFAHRLAWLFVHGRFPAHHIDHINGDRCDNRIANLRECTDGENSQNRKMQRNNASGYIGVGWHKLRKKWRASITVDTQHIHIGLFETKELAYEAYKRAKELYHVFEPVPIVDR